MQDSGSHPHGAGLAYGKQTAITASHWPADGGLIDRCDKFLSSPVFRLKLGIFVEAMLSVPGCFFGMPAVLAITPPFAVPSARQ